MNRHAIQWIRESETRTLMDLPHRGRTARAYTDIFISREMLRELDIVPPTRHYQFCVRTYWHDRRPEQRGKMLVESGPDFEAECFVMAAVSSQGEFIPTPVRGTGRIAD